MMQESRGGARYLSSPCMKMGFSMPPQWLWVVLLLLVLVALFSLLIHWRGVRTYWYIAQMPGLAGIPIIGIPWIVCTLKFKDLLPKGTEWFYRLSIVAFNLLGMPVVIMKEPEDIKYVMENTANIKKGFEYNCFRPWLREGLLVSHGKKWSERRKLLTPTFHFEILETSISGVWRNSNILVKRLIETSGKSFNVEETVRLYTLDVICETAMGVKLNAQENQGADYVAALKRASEVILMRALYIWLQSDWIFRLSVGGRAFYNDLKILHNFSEKVIADKRKLYKSEINANRQVKRKAFLDSLIELDEANPGLLSPLDIREEVDTFMFEGHDTTSAAVIFAFYLLAKHPAEQEEALKEQLEIFGDDWREPTMKDLQAMTYLEMVVKEVLRLFPSVPYFSRTLSKDIVLSDGLLIPKGTNVGVSAYHTHRNQKYWANPEEFIPRRFETGRASHPFAYLAFSAGPRNCIGQKFAMLEMKTTLSAVLRKCRLESVPTKISLEPVVILKNEEPIHIKVFPRNY